MPDKLVVEGGVGLYENYDEVQRIRVDGECLVGILCDWSGISHDLITELGGTYRITVERLTNDG